MKLLKNCTKIIAFVLFIAQGSWASGNVSLLVSVDWEGENLLQENLDAMNRFREEFPEIKLLHFLNAAYFTKPGADANAIKKKIRSVLRPGDEIGLHIHAWKSLLEASGVPFKSSPTYWGQPLYKASRDYGHEVALNAYSIDEIRSVLQFSVQMLERNGFGKPTSFRAGGWLASENVLEALARESFRVDSSAVPPSFLKDEIDNFPLFQWVQKLWSSTLPTSQPHGVKTNAGTILEIPDNGALADYMTSSEMVSVFNQNARNAIESQEVTLVQIGFHQETAHAYLSRVSQAIREMHRQAKRLGISIQTARLPIHTKIISL